MPQLNDFPAHWNGTKLKPATVEKWFAALTRWAEQPQPLTPPDLKQGLTRLTPAGLLREAIPVWASQLMHGGALGLSWNTFGLTREDLASLLTDAGLTVREGGPWERFAHRVDSSIKRDLMVAVKP